LPHLRQVKHAFLNFGNLDQDVSHLQDRPEPGELPPLGSGPALLFLHYFAAGLTPRTVDTSVGPRSRCWSATRIIDFRLQLRS
jgi:hypothetical protein